MPNKTLVPDKLQGYLLQVKHAMLRAVSQVPSQTEQSGEVERLDTYIRQLQLSSLFFMGFASL